MILLSVAAVLVATAVQPPLRDFQGTYDFDRGQKLEILAADKLFAVIDEAQYPLKSTGGDEFQTISGEPLVFKRDESAKVIGFVGKDGVLHRRLSTSITAETAALAHARVEGGAYVYHVPADMRDGIPTGDIGASALGLPVAQAIVKGIVDGSWKDVYSVLLYQHGKLVLEEYFYGYTQARTQQLRSATKSVVSTLAGIAIDKGAITSVAEPVTPHLSYLAYSNPDPRKAHIRLSDFLSMSSGLDCNDHSDTSPGRETVIDEQPDWVKSTLDLPMIHDPGSAGFYCSGGVAVVGRVVENATHAYLPDYAQANLFGPLGIQRNDWKWNYNLTNADNEYSQIHLRPRDMLKLGILFAQGGNWAGRQVISESWVKASTTKQSIVDDTNYGYFWWLPWLAVDTPSGMQRVYLTAAQGNGGQKIYVVPQYDLVAVFTGGAYNQGGSAPNKIMAKVILPALMAKFGQ